MDICQKRKGSMGVGIRRAGDGTMSAYDRLKVVSSMTDETKT